MSTIHPKQVRVRRPRFVPMLLLVGWYIAFMQDVAFSQLLPSITHIADIRHSSGWIVFRQGTNIDAATLFLQYKREFGLGPDDEMLLVSIRTDELGYTHHKYQQVHRGVPIEGAVFIVHSRNGRAEKANGKIVSSLTVSAFPAITKQGALLKAVNACVSKSFAWEDADYQRFMQNVTGDTRSGSSLPDPILVFTKANDDEDIGRDNIRLAYLINIQTTDDNGGSRYYVDAIAGNIRRMVPIARSCTSATANTIYYGQKQIKTKQVGSDYVLTDNCQTTTIETRSYTLPNHNEVSHSTTDWTTDVAHEPYTAAHWCAEKTYEYFNAIHMYSDYTAYDSKMLIVVGGTEGLQWWGDSRKYIQIGNTIGIASSDWPSTLDVIGHEWAHAITDASAGLLAFSDHGALYESFGYIFGEAVEWYAKNSAPSGLVSGQEALYASFQKNLCDHGDDKLDTYCDDNWEADTDIHARSGVQNRWFCLLVNGGFDTNDHCCDPQEYDVDGIGMRKAEKIAFRNLTNYMTPASNHVDARLGSINAGEDLVSTSDLTQGEADQIAEAWDAVGVYGNEVGWDIMLCGELSGTQEYKAMNRILALGAYCGVNSTVEVNSNAHIELTAGDHIRLTSGFRTNTECYLRARIASDLCEDFFSKRATAAGSQPEENQGLICVTSKSPTMLVYPSPSDGLSTAQFNLHRTGNVDLLLIDALGAVVQRPVQAAYLEKGGHSYRVETHGLSAGPYYLVLQTDDGSVSWPLIVR